MRTNTVLQARRNAEKKTLDAMIRLYCKGKGHDRCLCSDCQSLYYYAAKKTDACPFMARKTVCRECRVHCYAENYAEKIKEVMRFSGPRLVFTHPLISFKHLSGLLMARIERMKK